MCAGKKDFVTDKTLMVQKNVIKEDKFAILENHIYGIKQHSLMTK